FSRDWSSDVCSSDLDLEDTHGDLAVVDEDPVARLAVSGKPLIAGGDQLLGAGHVLSGDGEDVPFGELLGAAREVAETDLRALEEIGRASCRDRGQMR